MSLVYGFLHKYYVKAVVDEALSRNRRSLDLTNLDIQQIPDALFLSYDLHKLFLHKNKIEHLDSRIDRWNSLTVLALDYNRLTCLPPEIKDLKNLLYLNISHNPLKKLPPEIGELVSLEALWCNCIGADCIPEEVCKLTNLQTFGARKNKIRRLPSQFTSLTGLSWVTLQDNVIEELPEGLGALELVHLNVSVNCLRELPKDITKCKRLQYLLISHNQINCLPLTESTKWDLSEMESLVYIDLRCNPLIDDPYFKEIFQNYPQLKSNNEWGVLNINHENVEPESPESADSSETQPGANENMRENDDDDSDSSGYDDWENSIASSQLNSAEHSENELEENEIKGINIPIISRFAGTGS